MKTWKAFSINFFIPLDSLALTYINIYLINLYPLTRETPASIVNLKHCEGEENT